MRAGGWSSRRLASAIGVSDRTLRGWLSNDRQGPRWEVAQKLDVELQGLGSVLDLWTWDPGSTGISQPNSPIEPAPVENAEVIEQPAEDEAKTEPGVPQVVKEERPSSVTPPNLPPPSRAHGPSRDANLGSRRRWNGLWLVALAVVLVLITAATWARGFWSLDGPLKSPEPSAHSSSSSEPGLPPLGTPFLLRSSNYPDEYLEVDMSHAMLLRVDTAMDRSRATLVLTPGLAGEGVSLHLAAEPGVYLRHRDGYLRAEAKIRGDRLYNVDATYSIESALTGQPGLSLRSLNYPDRFVRHSGNIFYVEDEVARPGTPYAADASFTWVLANR